MARRGLIFVSLLAVFLAGCQDPYRQRRRAPRRAAPRRPGPRAR